MQIILTTLIIISAIILTIFIENEAIVDCTDAGLELSTCQQLNGVR